MLKQRVLTAIILAPLGIAAVLLLPTDRFWWLIVAIFAVAGWEWAQFLGWRSIGSRGGFALSSALLVMAGQFIDNGSLALIAGIAGVVTWAVGAAWLGHRQFGAAPPSTLSRSCKALFGLVAFVITATALVFVFEGEHGRYWLLMLLIVIWAADVGAYFSGRFLGRRKLAPNISPKKTWEGVWGGLSLAGLVCLGVAVYLDLALAQAVGLVATGLFTAAVSVVGDLFVSLLKRQVQLKDAGSLFPGHGGVLDRFDSLIAAAPIFLLGKTLLQL